MKQVHSFISLVMSGVCLCAPAWSLTSDSVEHKIVSGSHVQIEVTEQGSGPAIVILPSLGRSGKDYDKVASILAEQGFKVLRPEPRGIGLSKGPMENLTLHDFASDIAMVIEKEAGGSAVVVGHAWGNFAARMLATDRPDLVLGVVLAAASSGKVPPGSKELPIGPEMRKAIDGPSDLSLSKEKRLEYLKIAFFAPGNDASVWLDGWHEHTHEAQSHARNVTPVDEYFAAGRAPILDLQAESDTVAPQRFSKVLKSMLGERVTIEVIKNAGHALAPEQPEAMALAIARFATKLNSTSQSN
jgi:pimeloyl-ACP methyl ester carboxylesterase